MSIAIVEKEVVILHDVHVRGELRAAHPEPPVPNFMGNVIFISREDEDEGVSQAPSEVSAKGVEALLTTMDLYAKVFEQEGDVDNPAYK
jgi:hypothetical protein